jgi:glycosyltransferase involved in cell wall biosynthesis
VVVSERNTLYRTYSSRLKKSALLGLKKILYKQADVVTVVSEGIKKEMIKEFSIEDHKIQVVNNPLIDASLFDLSNEPISEKYNSKFLVVAVGRFVKQKDYPTLLRAFSSFKNEVENAVLVILGKGPLLNEMKQLASNLEISNQVDFLGFDSNPYKYMSKCNLFILSSLHEGMPGVLIQALALGAVCVSTDCPTGPNELIRNEENGFLVPVGDSVKLTRRMISLSTPEYNLNEIKKNAKLSISKYEITAGVESYFKTI